MNELIKDWNMLREILDDAQTDFDKFTNGNASAGTRVRKTMQDMKALAQAIRLNVQEIKNS